MSNASPQSEVPNLNQPSTLVGELRDYIFQKRSPNINLGICFLRDSQFPEGSWQKSYWHTALGAIALVETGGGNSSELYHAMMWLVGQQDTRSGSWEESYWETGHVILALVETRDYWLSWPNQDQIEECLSNGITWIIQRVRGGPHWNDMYDVAIVLQALAESHKFSQAVSEKLIEELTTTLIENQGANGSWGDGTLTTSLALEALSIMDKQDHKVNIDMGKSFLLGKQNKTNGSWGDSRHTAEAIRALLVSAYDRDKSQIGYAVGLGIQNLKSVQNKNGSWYGRVESTASAILALKDSGESPDDVLNIPFSEVESRFSKVIQESTALRFVIREKETEITKVQREIHDLVQIQVEKEREELKQIHSKVSSLEDQVKELQRTSNTRGLLNVILAIIAAAFVALYAGSQPAVYNFVTRNPALSLFFIIIVPTASLILSLISRSSKK